MNALIVGQPYIEGETDWLEHVEYNYRSGQHELRLFIRNITPKEEVAIRHGESRFAAATHQDVIYFCAKFGDMDWVDGTFSIHLVPEAERELPDPNVLSKRALLAIILIEATTGLIRGLRTTTLSPMLTRYLEAKIGFQAARPYPGEDACLKQIARVHSVYDSTEIANRLALVRCKGGE